ncbi:MAG: sigma factor-like helix-turn-helix DNA-binding protein, partial [Oscillospiraceae bacterium]|nr:sigma factor-like helix-turn-helix DNA-binding protein [Oscillospiraceae bacterium]
FFKGQTQSDAAKRLGMSQVQVSRREKVILSEMRKKMAG